MAHSPAWAPATFPLLVGGMLLTILSVVDGPAARGMTLHVLAMSAAAPLVVLLLERLSGKPTRSGAGLFAATAFQVFLLYLWHTPAAMSAAMHSGWIMALMHLSLFLSALFFWARIRSSAGARPWAAIAALIISGKLFCLLAVLLVFSPRPTLQTMSSMDPASLLADQQTAGLIMLAVCPMAYIAVAVAIAAQWLTKASAAPTTTPSQTLAR